MTIRPRRSVLYMPGSNARALEKAKTLPADALILDLEDAVAPEAKEAAREQVVAAVKGGGYGGREIVIRVNGLATPWGEADLKAAAIAGADAILLPKVQAAADLEAVRAVLQGAGVAPSQPLWAMMETPLAILNAAAIAAAGPGTYPLVAFVMGTNDIAKETRASLAGGRIGMLSWLSTCIAAGRAYGIEVLDGVFNGIGDEAGLRAELEQGRLLGMDGKTLIHPSQIEPCNAVFSPSAEEVESARKIIAAFALPENLGKGVISLDGRMVELMHAEIAERTVAIADAIAARENA
ncbi:MULTISPECIES: CoA ester lyase [Rhodomicrobium]|uniref:HpcH/HpaI aldolase/citrate lyase family protein n=1 Tax=Rhodomicrobium TaxID=1068 RepID=UPI000B4B4001|nr:MULTISPECIES: CoA ester lyase [Rhodomicrobium]